MYINSYINYEPIPTYLLTLKWKNERENNQLTNFPLLTLLEKYYYNNDTSLFFIVKKGQHDKITTYNSGFKKS